MQKKGGRHQATTEPAVSCQHSIRDKVMSGWLACTAAASLGLASPAVAELSPAALATVPPAFAGQGASFLSSTGQSVTHAAAAKYIALQGSRLCTWHVSINTYITVLTTLTSAHSLNSVTLSCFLASCATTNQFHAVSTPHRLPAAEAHISCDSTAQHLITLQRFASLQPDSISSSRLQKKAQLLNN